MTGRGGTRSRPAPSELETASGSAFALIIDRGLEETLDGHGLYIPAGHRRTSSMAPRRGGSTGSRSWVKSPPTLLSAVGSESSLPKDSPFLSTRAPFPRRVGSTSSVPVMRRDSGNGAACPLLPFSPIQFEGAIKLTKRGWDMPKFPRQ